MTKQYSIVLSLVVATAVSLHGSMALGQVQTPEQRKCLNQMNGAGAALAKLQGGEGMACLKKAGAGTLIGSAQACLTADANGKIAKRKAKTVTFAGNLCGTAPNFGYTGPTAVNDSVAEKVALIADVFGADLGAAVIPCATSKPGCTCQRAVLGQVEKLAAAKINLFRNCKASALKAGATSAAALADCVDDPGTDLSIATDKRGVIQKRITALTNAIVKKCDTPGISGGFPGDCAGGTGATLAACLDVHVECRVCRLINAMDGLSVDCDLFDDGLANSSCEVPTPPTPTPEPSPTPTPDESLVFGGALLRSTGRFTYAATVGVAGADIACNTNFPGTHACTLVDLQAAEAAGGLVGAQDTATNSVTSFWAIDSTRPDTQQCHVTIAWDYATAHTGHFADVVTLNNGTGALGTVTTGACLNQHWVGCCF